MQSFHLAHDKVDSASALHVYLGPAGFAAKEPFLYRCYSGGLDYPVRPRLFQGRMGQSRAIQEMQHFLTSNLANQRKRHENSTSVHDCAGSLCRSLQLPA
jgi:hypothetical protein